ncbi:MAG: PaaI family thioesterase [Candidatus Lambdaproteobacteria bacterium]|nr:PaaI family thioesterase [Candidatus Lambdaproteobacteria bacterium]
MEPALNFPRYTPEEKAHRMQAVYERRPLIETLAIRFQDMEPGHVKLVWPVLAGYTNAGGAVHGGIVMTLADEAMAKVLSSALPLGTGQTSIEMKLNFLDAAKGAILHGEGRLLRRGSRVAVAEAEITDEQGALVAKALGTYAVFPHRAAAAR